jgi:hypothetical protein
MSSGCKAKLSENFLRRFFDMKKIGIYLTLLFALTLAISAAFAQGGLPGSGWWSGEQVQNVGDDDATITVTAYDKDTTDTFSASETVASGGAFTFLPNSFADMPSGFQGSAVVSSNQPIKAIVNVTNRLSGDLGIDGGKAAAQYQGVDGSMVADTLYFPLVKGNHYSKTTTFYVQNAGSADATNVVATFNMANGDSFTYNVPAIAPNKMVAFSVFDAADYDGTCTPEGTCRKGGLIVTSDQPLAGTVMEHYTTESLPQLHKAPVPLPLAISSTPPTLLSSRTPATTASPVSRYRT